MISVGVDIGGSKIAIGLVKDGVILEKVILQNNFLHAPERMACAVRNTLERWAGLDISSVGLGCPGWVIDGVVYDAVNLGIQEYPLKQVMQDLLKITVFVENDARTALLGEFRCGALQDCVNGAMVTFGTGIGGGLIINREIFCGSFGYAGEVGHLSINDREDCKCGKRGCYELSSAVPALIRLAQSKGLCVADGKQIFEAAQAQSAPALETLTEYVGSAAKGLIELTMLLDLDTVAIGGGISSQAELFVTPLCRKVHQFSPRCKIVPAKLGNDASIIGAAMLRGKL